MVIDLFGKGLGESLAYILAVMLRILPLTSLASSSVMVWKLSQVWTLGRDWDFFQELVPPAFQSPILNIFCWYKLSCPSVLPLGTLCWINHLHNYLWARSSWLPLQHYQSLWELSFSRFQKLSSAIWPLLFYGPVVPIAISEPSSVTVSSIISPGLWRRATT